MCPAYSSSMGITSPIHKGALKRDQYYTYFLLYCFKDRNESLTTISQFP